jgi:hypothetical protein
MGFIQACSQPTCLLEMLLGVFGEWGGRERLISLSTSSDTPGLLTQPFLAATWVVTEHWVVLSTQHRTGEVHAGKGNTHWPEGARNTPPRGTCKQRRSLQIQGCHNLTGTEEVQSSKKKPLLNDNAQCGAWSAPSLSESDALQTGD